MSHSRRISRVILRPLRRCRMTTMNGPGYGSPSAKRKGKQRADSGSSSIEYGSRDPDHGLGHVRAGSRGSDATIPEAIDEALSTPLPPPTFDPEYGSSFGGPSPIAHPPRAHHPPSFLPPPKLLSQLARSTLPTASLNYASAAGDRAPRGRSDRMASQNAWAKPGDSSTSWLKESAGTMAEEAFPELDPTTGLPLGSASSGADGYDRPSLYLQRTITDLLANPPSVSPDLSSYIPKISLPSIGLPGKSALDSGKRSFSSSAATEAWWPNGWWGNNKSKVDRHLTEEDRADTVEEEKEKIQRKYRAPKHPVVFCHGLLGFDYVGPASMPALQISHWRGIREVLESNGVEVLIGRVPATASIADRAAALEELIEEKFPGREVNLIGHSMGGLDCRYLVSSMKPKNFKPVSLTTISTPHRGSPFADYVIDNVIGRDRLPMLLALVESLGLPQTGDGSAFGALETQAMKVFNSEILDREDVKYYSWGASFEPGLLDTFRWPHTVILAKDGPNDGLVSVNSARWGEYRGTLMGVNHLDLVGWVNTVRYAISEWTGRPIAFKPATFYLEVADYLAEQGF